MGQHQPFHLGRRELALPTAARWRALQHPHRHLEADRPDRCTHRTPRPHRGLVGERVAEFFALQFPPHLAAHDLRACGGAGYPDKILVRREHNDIYPLELKATSTWNVADSNRRVLTSSSRKLRERFRGAINHLLATILYGQRGADWFIRSIRLDFIGPNTLVNIRLEASVSHRLLSQATHATITVP